MYCIRCGDKIPDDSIFCPACGYQLNADNKETSKTTEVERNDANIKSISDNTAPYSSGYKSHGINGYIAMAVFALVIAGVITFIYSSGNTDFDKTTLNKTTITAADTTLSISVPFELKDEKFDLPDECDKAVYKIGQSQNYSIEVIGCHYKDKNVTFDYPSVIDLFIQEMKKSKEVFFSKPPQPAIETSLNGRKAGKTTFYIKDMASQQKLEGNMYALSKANEVWIIMILYKEKDNSAKNFTEKIINTIELK